MTGLGQPAIAVTRPASSSLLELAGELTAAVAILPVEAATAQAMLPSGLRLAKQNLMRADQHPLVLILGRQANARARRLPLRTSYLECIAVLPFVEAGSRGPLCHMPRLFLDRQLPTLLGRWLYGYDKRRARMTMTDDRYEVVDRNDGRPLLAARYQTRGPAVDARRLGSLRALFDLPIISRKAGRWSYSRAAFDLDGARVEPLMLELRIESAALSNLPPLETRIDGIAEGQAAFRLTTSWTLAGPWRTPPMS